MNQILAWGGFTVFIIAMLALDLFVFQRKPHEIRVRESLLLTAFWIFIALSFNAGIALLRGHQLALEFLTGFLIEKSLSVDNIFIFLLIFNYFRVPSSLQPRVLFWGVLGAIVLRAVFVIAGIALIHAFHWVIYVFGGILVVTGIKMIFEKEEEIHPEHNPVLKIFRKFMPVTKNYEGDRFFVKREGRLFATPLLVVLLLVESTDVIFAVDSIPAIFAVTLDPFIVYTSNIFAILGLRALYFALAGVMCKVYYLSYGLAAILVFVGVKMLISDYYKIPIGFALGFIAFVLAVSIAVSFLKPPRECKF